MVLFELLKKFKGFPFFVILLGLINSFFYTGILVLISRILSDTPMIIPFIPNWLLFCLLVTLAYLSSKIFQTYMIRATHTIIYEFEISLLQQVRGSSLSDLEKIGKNKILSAVEDTRVIGEAPEIFINTFNAIIIVLSCLGYIYTVSWQGGMCILFVMFFLIGVYLRQNKSIEKQLNILRDNQNNYFRYMFDLLQGFKEIKMSVRRNETLFNEYLKLNRIDGRNIGISARLKDLNNELLGNLSWYIVIGLIMYLLPAVLSIDKERINSLVMAVLYMMGPVSTLIMFIYHFTRVKIAYQRLKLLENEVQILPSLPIDGSSDGTNATEDRFSALKIDKVGYQYTDKEHGTTFTLEPVSLVIKKGETVFVTGGNGSGKSTFMNILTGLYRPMQGTLQLNDEVITDEKIAWYSNQISVVFSDFYLFSENYNKFDLSENNREFSVYSNLMKMKNLIRFNNKDNKIEANFSRGQQKRMALIYCLLENRELFILDEWASEQDPGFRNYFYTQILPVLKEQGKTVIAVTHDDQYFRCADRILEFDYGKLIHDRNMKVSSLDVV